MIEVLSIQKKQEGMLNKYFWDFKINDRLHNIQFVDLPFGKKQVWIDQKEVLDSRIFVGSKLLFPFEIDNYEFEIRADAEDYDIYEKSKLKNKLKNIQLEQDFKQKKSIVHQKDRYMNMGNINQKTKPVIQKQIDNQQTQQFGKEDDLFNFDDFHNKGDKIDPFEDDKQTQKKVTINFDDFNFKQNTQKKFKIFDDNNISPNTQDDENKLTKIKQMNLVYDSDNKQYKVCDDNKDIEDQFYTSEDFDKQLDEQLQKQNSRSDFYKRPFDMDPEEAVESLNSGLKNVFNKTKNLVGKLEDKCKNIMNKYDTSDDITPNQNEDFKNFGANIKMFDDNLQFDDNINSKKQEIQNTYFQQKQNNVQQNLPSQETPFLEEYINNNTIKKKPSNSLNDFQFDNFQESSKKVHLQQKKTQDQDLLEKVLGEDFLNLDQKISTPFDQLISQKNYLSNKVLIGPKSQFLFLSSINKFLYIRSSSFISSQGKQETLPALKNIYLVTLSYRVCLTDFFNSSIPYPVCADVIKTSDYKISSQSEKGQQRDQIFLYTRSQETLSTLLNTNYIGKFKCFIQLNIILSVISIPTDKSITKYILHNRVENVTQFFISFLF